MSISTIPTLSKCAQNRFAHLNGLPVFSAVFQATCMILKRHRTWRQLQRITQSCRKRIEILISVSSHYRYCSQAPLCFQKVSFLPSMSLPQGSFVAGQELKFLGVSSPALLAFAKVWTDEDILLSVFETKHGKPSIFRETKEKWRFPPHQEGGRGIEILEKQEPRGVVYPRHPVESAGPLREQW